MCLDHESLDLILQASYLVHEVRCFVGGNTGTDDSPGNTAGTSEGGLAWNIDVWNVLVLAQEWKMEENGERSSVCGEDDDLADTTVEGLGSFVGTLLELAVVRGLLNDVENLLGCERKQLAIVHGMVGLLGSY